MAVLALFSSGEASDEQKLADFRRDCGTVDQSLMEATIQSVTAGVPNFYDKLHLSPIKVCIIVILTIAVINVVICLLI